MSVVSRLKNVCCSTSVKTEQSTCKLTKWEGKTDSLVLFSSQMLVLKIATTFHGPFRATGPVPWKASLASL